MNNPGAPSERQLLAWQDIAAPPKLFPADPRGRALINGRADKGGHEQARERQN